MAVLAAGAVLATGVALAARAAGALSASGAIAASVVGTLAVGAGWDWAVVLIGYFVTSSLLSRLGRAERERRTEGRIEKGGPRDAVQVAANGGVFAVAAVAFAGTGNPVWQLVGVASLAAAAADTWATEIGTLSRASARSILTGRVMPAGTSGAVTGQGLMAALAGAAFVAGMASSFGWGREAVNAAVAGGILGSLLDSVLGATAQSRRWCAACGSGTEQRTHRCGTRTEVRGGIPWLDNDGVNLVSTIVGALAGALVGTRL